MLMSKVVSGEVVLWGGELEGAETPPEDDFPAIDPSLARALARSAGAASCWRDLTLKVSRRRARPSGPGGSRTLEGIIVDSREIEL